MSSFIDMHFVDNLVDKAVNFLCVLLGDCMIMGAVK